MTANDVKNIIEEFEMELMRSKMNDCESKN